MIITIKSGTTEKDINQLLATISESGYHPRLVKGEKKTIIELIGSGTIDIDDLNKFTYVENVHRIQKPYKRISSEGIRDPKIVNVKGRKIGGPGLVIMIGPCAVESFEQTEKTARMVAEYETDEFITGFILRGGAFKPRTSPYAFEGLGEEGLKILRQVGDQFSLPVITEIMGSSEVDVVEKYADIFQVGTRNFQNFRLLDALGEAKKPVLLKRGMSGSIDEFLLSAERIVARGNENVILCLRGIRTFNDAYRNDVDVADVVRLKQLTNLPVIFDPSHSTGNRDAIIPVSMGAIAMGIDGLLADLHFNPEAALVDGAQALWPAQGEALIKMAREFKKTEMASQKYYITAEDARK